MKTLNDLRELTLKSESEIRIIVIPYENLSLPDSRADYMLSFLGNDERQRYAGYRFPKSKREFLVSRFALRLFLGRLLHVEPASVRFDYNSFGKPILSRENRCTEIGRLFFNVSHSSGCTAYVFSLNNEVGIDLEKNRERRIDYLSIAEQYFSAEELSAITLAEEDGRQTAFFAIFTLKEACLKAIGTGLSVPLNSFSVPASGASGTFDIFSFVRFTFHGSFTVSACIRNQERKSLNWRQEKIDLESLLDTEFTGER